MCRRQKETQKEKTANSADKFLPVLYKYLSWDGSFFFLVEFQERMAELRQRAVASKGTDLDTETENEAGNQDSDAVGKFNFYFYFSNHFY